MTTLPYAVHRNLDLEAALARNLCLQADRYRATALTMPSSLLQHAVRVPLSVFVSLCADASPAVRRMARIAVQNRIKP